MNQLQGLVNFQAPIVSLLHTRGLADFLHNPIPALLDYRQAPEGGMPRQHPVPPPVPLARITCPSPDYDPALASRMGGVSMVPLANVRLGGNI